MSENEKLVEKLRARCIDDAGCWVWQGACSNGGHPVQRINGKVTSVRRTLFVELVGVLYAGRIVRMTCGTPNCVAPDHMQSTTTKKLCIELGAIGVMGGPVRAAKAAAFHRTGPHAKLTIEGVKRIRGSLETVAALALEHGVAQNTIRRVQQGAAWRNHSNPFAGLGARA